MANNLWSNYTQKDTPVDNDELMIYDSEGKNNKKLLFGGFWKWIAKKLKEAELADLQTADKTVVGAINYLYGNSEKSFIKAMETGTYDYNQYTPEQAAKDIIDNKLNANSQIVQLIGFICASRYFMIVQKHTSSFCSFLLFGYATDNIIYRVERDGVWN